ncbi:cell division protein DivIVA [Enterococcus faecalis]|uniref:cell division protein DivIVA n=1 Tax=Enterococcus faecalis TaxID=1351 RepID=UPI0001B2E19E|nr:cell division protein DivIVA [Enterococcus faecalis]EEU76587.1 cell division protein DivIVA [Enterococcus faecalis E1Sol]EGO8664166.1 DivIVA domain-containing protein [Enterococcus faecalis]EGS8048511.1 DivIVA domain-containing protein [Enterococcus faecalis]EHD3774784.1 DivIVA domain-containing protein [Enterococcus faecalis]EHF1125647.1 DivIVA domain-containing protein [Enterococcus faecalis]
MALTPLDIQNKDFSTKMRGYNQDDVDDFLDQVTRDYEDALQKNRELEKSLKHAEEKLQYFNELKDALNQSIIVAQDTADKVKSSANKESEMIITSADNQAKETLVEAERKSNAMIADAEAKSTQILAEAIERARQLAGETEDLKKKTRVFHQRLSLMLETQLEQVKSEEWEEILKPFSSYVGDKHTAVKEILDEQDLDNENETVVNSEENTDAVVEKNPVIEVTEETIEEESK